MPIEIKQGGIEEKILRYLQKVYPATIDDIVEELSVNKDRIDLAINRLLAQGIIQLEPLSDKEYIRLKRRDFHFIGRKVTQRKSLKRKGGRTKGRDYDGFAYG